MGPAVREGISNTRRTSQSRQKERNVSKPELIPEIIPVEDPVVAFIPIARNTAIKIHRRVRGAVDLDDLVGEANRLLVTLFTSFDPSKGKALKNWLANKIEWGLVDYLRSVD